MAEDSETAMMVRMYPSTEKKLRELTGLPEKVDRPIIFEKAAEMLEGFIAGQRTRSR
jgi:hypothetical protein